MGEVSLQVLKNDLLGLKEPVSCCVNYGKRWATDFFSSNNPSLEQRLLMVVAGPINLPDVLFNGMHVIVSNLH